MFTCSTVKRCRLNDRLRRRTAAAPTESSAGLSRASLKVVLLQKSVACRGDDFRDPEEYKAETEKLATNYTPE